MDKLEVTVTRWLTVKAEGKLALGVLAALAICSVTAIGFWAMR
jgi:hypothetical protein